MFTAISVAAPAVPVAVKVNGEFITVPLGVEAEAVSLFDPAVVPNVQLVTFAIPLVFVFTVFGDTVPPPSVTVNVTETPLSAVLFASFTMTLGGVVTAVPTGAV